MSAGVSGCARHHFVCILCAGMLMNNRLLRGPGQCRKKVSLKMKWDVGMTRGDTRRHCEVELTIFRNPPPYISFFGGCGRLLHTVNSTLLVSPVFGMVSSLHPTSDFYTCNTMFHTV